MEFSIEACNFVQKVIRLTWDDSKVVEFGITDCLMVVGEV